jgi:hypothetical protein
VTGAAGLVARAEVLKLARLLGLPAARLDYLRSCAPEDLAALRMRVTDVLFDGDRHRLRRIAEAGRVVPIALMATIGQKAFGPLLCARLTGLLDPERAVAVGQRLPAAFLADVAAELDPRRATAVIVGMPVELLTAVAPILAERGETVAMGRFVAFLPDAMLAACTAQIDDASLLRTAFVLEGKDRLDHVIALLPDERLARMLDVVAEQELWVEALDLLAHLGEVQLDRLGGLADGRDPAPYAGLVAAAQEHGVPEVVSRARAHGLAL